LKRIVLILVLFAAPVYASLDSVRQNFINYYSAAGADRDAGRMRDALAALETSSRAYSAPGYLLSDGSWGDIDRSDPDPYTPYHSTWCAINGLMDYAFNEERVSFPEALSRVNGEKT